MKLTTHLHLVPRLRMSGSITVLPPICLHVVDRNLFICIFSKWAPKSVKLRYRNVGNCEMHVVISISLFTPKTFIPDHLLKLINDGESVRRSGYAEMKSHDRAE